MIWKKIQEYDYSINEEGQVKNDKTGKILKGWFRKDGYHQICLIDNNKNKRKFYIHRLLAKNFLENYSDELFVDHIDRNPSNNSLINLRMVNHQENICNQNKHKNCSSIYKGVYYFKRVNKWNSQIQINGKRISLGHFISQEEAAKAYNEYIDQNNLQYYSKNIF